MSDITEHFWSGLTGWHGRDAHAGCGALEVSSKLRRPKPQVLPVARYQVKRQILGKVVARFLATIGVKIDALKLEGIFSDLN
ncbi:hypothetical protein NO263_03385 [Gluconacetobacter entanii]|uniref:Transposase n=1 Tax=Gluconacetobacter entanii TaxID=108528 RepID=A0ABT3K2I3_9PROT|nr:hypothetical protein [Gluconacetobacter entanii]MCW4589618.1 hypothetical protein [Gluconacetobacter entanii]MCW4592930.1 hypothetical protein [Gluconacetobacter entanii]